MGKGSSKRILLVHQTVCAPGGANAVGVWVLEALKDEYEVTVLTWDRIDVSDINRFYGTSLRDGDFRIITPGFVVRTLRRLDPDLGSLQIPAYLMRVCHRIRASFDLVVSTSVEELDLGGPGLLYIHYPSLARFWHRYQDCGGKPLSTKVYGLLTGKTRPWMALADYSVDRLKLATVLTNSNWTGGEMEKAYGVRSTTLYPPVSGGVTGMEWNCRQNSFLASGRFNQQKRLEWIVKVLKEVRLAVPDLTLHLVGTIEPRFDGLRYYREIKEIIAQNADWVTLHEDLSRDKLTELTGSVRYGIHAQVDEHFGIAPAEALLAGCIPFVHDSGGQVEISADKRLCFSSEEDAVRKIRAVLQDEELQHAILRSLEPRRQMFTTAQFVDGFRAAARDAMARSASPRIASIKPSGE